MSAAANNMNPTSANYTAAVAAAVAAINATTAAASSSATAAPPPVSLADEEAARAKAEDASVGQTTSEVFTNYTPSNPNVPGGPHPGDVAEAASLAATSAPPCEYTLCPALLEDTKLSNLQLETIQLASTRHLSVVPTTPPTRCGFFLGDGAGVGKGRQLAGIILDQLSRGRSKHVWFSISSDLRTDAERDLRDLGCHVAVHDGCQGLDKGNKGFGLSKEMQSGVLFSTYSTLVSATSGQKAKGGSRLSQLVDWCGGPSFEGCLMFDECHKAKNWTGKEETSSKVAQSVLELQKLLPLARIVYCSATGASDLSNMAYMERLALWGPLSAFPTFNTFTEGVTGRGVGGLEMLAMEMKASGSYLSRGLSYKDAEFMLDVAPLTSAQRAEFDAAALFWSQRLLPELESAIERSGHQAGLITRQYWSAHQRFFKQLCVCAKVPALIQRVKKALREGYAPIIGPQSTGEAALDRAVAADSDLREPISLCQAQLLGFIENNFPTSLAPDQKVAKDVTKAERMLEMTLEACAAARAAFLQNSSLPIFREALQKAETDHAMASMQLTQLRRQAEVNAANAGIEIPELVQRKAMLMHEAQSLTLPPAALDMIIDECGGPSNVAEMTGRKARMVRTPDGKRFMLAARAKPESNEMDNLNVTERNAFMDGKKLIAIISDAASTGISLQADLRVKNQRRRCHITLELAWSGTRRCSNWAARTGPTKSRLPSTYC